MEDFSRHILGKPATDDLTWRVLRAAHKYSTMREIEMLRMVNEPFRLVGIEKGIHKDIEGFLDLRGLQLLISKQQPYEFLMEIERLRFQTRWNQTPRVPRTSVLGHSYYVAALTLLMGRDLGICCARSYNNFFSALFHDLPEAVTRDIISPVKQATDNLPGIIKELEDQIVRRELLPLMDGCFRDEIMYFINNEFENRIRGEDGETRIVAFEDLQGKYNADAFAPVDGKLVRAADHIAAFVEADSSINYGITSNHLRDGRKNILAIYPDGKKINGMDIARPLLLQDGDLHPPVLRTFCFRIVAGHRSCSTVSGEDEPVGGESPFRHFVNDFLRPPHRQFLFAFSPADRCRMPFDQKAAFGYQAKRFRHCIEPVRFVAEECVAVRSKP